MDYEQLALTFRALSHPIRLQILDLLRGGEVCVCHIETALGKRQAYISQQLMTLREVGLVESRREGLQVYYRLADGLIGDLLLVVGADDPPQCEVLERCPCPACHEKEFMPC